MLRSCLAFVLFISCIEIYVSSVIVPFVDCGSHSFNVEKLDFSCEDGMPKPCKFKKGKTYRGNFSLTATADVSNGTIVLHAIIGGASLPFPMDNPNICSDHNLSCPIKSGTKAVMTVQLTVPSLAPTVNLVAEFEIQPLSESSTAIADIMCVKFLAAIEDSNEITVWIFNSERR